MALPSRSELMYFALGLSIGGAVGANWSKIQPLLIAFMGPAAEGFKDAYGDLLTKFAEQAQEHSESSDASEEPKPRKKKGKKKSRKMPFRFEDLVESALSN